MVKQNFSLKMGINLPKDGFSLDELVIETKRVFETEGMVGFLRVVMILLDHLIYPSLLGKWDKDVGFAKCCDHAHYVVSQSESKNIFTSVGKLQALWTRIRCAACGKSIIPLRGYLGLEPYQRKTPELEQIVTEVVSEQSYRRTSQHLQTIGSIPVPFTTLHRWVMKSDCDKIDPKKRKLQNLVADGTGFKQKPVDDSNRGEVKVMVGITKTGVVVPIGAWTEESWSQIGREVKKANHPHPNIKFNPIAEMLVSDGEIELTRGLKNLTKEQQRCVWHLSHDLGPTLKYQDEAPKQEAKDYQSEFATIIDIELPKEDFQEVKLEDKLEIEKQMFLAEKEVQRLIEEFKVKGYKSAATYLKNAKEKMFTYVRSWLRSGIINPRVSSMIERMMREIGRRIKKIGFGWSPKGAAKMTRIIIKRITSADEWNEYWKKKLRLTGKVKIDFLGCDFA